MSARRGLLAVALLVSCAGLSLLGWWVLRPGLPAAVEVKPAAARSPQVPKTVSGGLDQVLAVMTLGGTALERAQAIETLDTSTRLGTTLPDDARAALLSAMEQGGPGTMDEGAWSHLFNCSCNALAVGQTGPDEKFIALLERIAVDDPRLVMRLYALQHLGVRYDTATPACQKRLRALVQRMSAAPDSQTAGMALVLLARWESAAETGGVSAFALGKAVVEDTARPIDVRVTALHAIGFDPAVLVLARTIAPDPAQPVILRKAALNLIGRHGQERDLAVLRQCSQESPRLAQAGNPAAITLENRLAGSPSPVLIPIQ